MSTRTLTISPGLSLPLDIITMRTAEYGDSGSGKTAFARLIAEKVHESSHRFCAIDLKNDWWGLQSSADGASAGIPVVIFGGPRASVKIFPDPAAAATLADTVASIDQSVIIDLDAMSRNAQERFLAPFLDRLYEANRRPLLLICDEADRYAPQKPMSQEAIMSLSSSEDIARRGRKRGVGSMWLTQRTAVLNKNVSEFANLTVVFRTPGEKDLNELEDRVGRIASKEVVKEVMRLAPGLADGEAFFLSSHPKLRKYMPHPVRPVQLPMPWTFDSSATPGVGQRRREPKVLAKADLAAIEQKMQKQVEEAKANDPKALRAELHRAKAELEKTLRAKSSAASVPERDMKLAIDKVSKQSAAIISQLRKAAEVAMKFIVEINAKDFFKAGGEAIDKQQIQKAIDNAVQQATAMIERNLAGRNRQLEEMKKDGERVVKVLRSLLDVKEDEVVKVQVDVRHQEPFAIKAGSMRERPPSSSPAEITGGLDQRIIDAIAWWNAANVDRPTRAQVAFVAGSAPTGGYFTNTLGKLRSAGIVDYPSPGALALSIEGQAKAKAPDHAPTYEDLIDRARAAVKKGHQRRIFDALVEAGKAMTREELAAASGFSDGGGYFTNTLGSMRSGGIIDYPEPGKVALSSAFDGSNGLIGGNYA